MSEETTKGLLYEMFLDAISEATAHQKTFGNTDEVDPQKYVDRAMNVVEMYGSQMKIEQSYRCQELIEANRRSNEDGEYYGEVALLDVDDLEDAIESQES